MKTCLFAGTFDPFTIGHLNIVKKALATFDKVVVAIGENKEKTPYFSLSERLEIINSVFIQEKRVTVTKFDGYLVDFMRDNGIVYNVRGIRNGKDLEYENRMERFNSERYPSLITLFYPIEEKYEKISSTMVKLAIKNSGNLSGLIPENAIETLNDIIKKHAKKEK